MRKRMLRSNSSPFFYDNSLTSSDSFLELLIIWKETEKIFVFPPPPEKFRGGKKKNKLFAPPNNRKKDKKKKFFF